MKSGITGVVRRIPLQFYEGGGIGLLFVLYITRTILRQLPTEYRNLTNSSPPGCARPVRTEILSRGAGETKDPRKNNSNGTLCPWVS